MPMSIQRIPITILEELMKLINLKERPCVVCGFMASTKFETLKTLRHR